MSTDLSPDPPTEEPSEEGIGSRIVAAVTSVSVVTTLLAVAVALVIGGLLVAVADDDTASAMSYFTARPTDTLRAAWDAVSSAYAALLNGALGSGNALSETLTTASPLILAGLAVAVPLRAGLFNIGGEGQVLAGGAAAGLVGFSFIGLPLVIHLPLALLAGLLAGAAVGAIPGALKARTGAHEVITTIMLNNIIASLLAALLVTALFQRPGATNPISKTIQDSARLPSPEGVRLDAGLLVALVVAVGIWWLVERSSLGFQIRAVGANAVAAVTAGMSAASTTVLTMAIAGAAGGLAGSAMVLGASGQGAVTGTFSAGVGFDGITVALLGRGRAGGTVAAGLLFGALRAGGTQMQARTGTSVDLVVVIQALVILFVAAPVVIQSMFRLRRSGPGGPQVAQGWGA